MFKIRIADTNILIKNRYDYLPRLCKDYMIDDASPTDMEVEVSEADIDGELVPPNETATRGYAEGICIYRSICKLLPLRCEAYLMHAAVVEKDGVAYAFCARSGVGKSTHVALWREAFGESVRIINGDKPILRFIDGELYAYGTPWCGKEGWSINTRAPLAAICFLERREANSIAQISAAEAVVRVFHQILGPKDMQEADALLPLIDKTLKKIPCYLLRCNMQQEAANVAYNSMKPRK